MSTTGDEPDVPPPGYSERLEFPPDYSASATHHTIGGQKLFSPLIRHSHIQAHLCLLRAIYNMRATILSGEDKRIPQEAMKLDATQRWAWFVGLAVERCVLTLLRSRITNALSSRFTRWVSYTRVAPLQQWIQEELPPLDVLMVWHAYTLNPMSVIWEPMPIRNVTNLGQVVCRRH